ncbi:hypothetical protein BD309DRAFT_911182 [Dichomitus squalens]|uniref:Uncharacterized protein n=1 Tax=Dichomitus squalens TaxID=114155 RepID=A0A4Q9P461_9APHY|nr:hypothetical protein BD309DRAFT_911182 [Dichomitus squalens]TBU57963.1 hypothetical protein BD310DRAFT_851973 [Dichomitus squalens]
MSDPAVENFLRVPDFLQSHSELRRRGVTLATAIKPPVVYETALDEIPPMVVKVLNPDNEEAGVLEKFQTDLRSPNHVIPGEVIRSTPPLLLMPCILELKNIDLYKAPLTVLVNLFLQILEGVDHLHSQRVAHLDLCTGNITAAFDEHAVHDRRIEAGKIYLIDFQTSRQLKLRPGEQPAVLLPKTQVPPPGGMKHFDPYSWNVYCLGNVFQRRLKLYSFGRPGEPWIIRRYIQWLTGTERGCVAVCHCRPTARRALNMLIVIRWVVRTYETLWRLSSLIISVMGCDVAP